jgi:hypothetical protein
VHIQIVQFGASGRAERSIPLIRDAIPDPAICEGVAAPSMISFMAHPL